MQRVTLELSQIHEDCIDLTDPQVHYLRRVLRLGTGDRFIALDGQGQGWVASLGEDIHQAHIVESWQWDTELAIPVHLIIAMPKTGMDDIVRQSTELGVASICPVISDRTILKPSAKKVDRWRRIAQEAIEQCERQWVPTIHAPMTLASGLALYATPAPSPSLLPSVPLEEIDNPQAQRWICVARPRVGEQDYRPRLLLSAMLDMNPDGVVGCVDHPVKRVKNGEQRMTSICIAVGPEGGWTPAEVEAAIALGYDPISLGTRILRAVTAPLGAIAVIAAVLDYHNNSSVVTGNTQ